MALLALLSTVAVAATPPCPPASRPGWDRSGSDCDDAHGLERWIRSRMLSVHPCRKMPVLWPAASQAQGRTMLKASWLFWHEWCKPSEIIVTKLVGTKFASASVLTRFSIVIYIQVFLWMYPNILYSIFPLCFHVCMCAWGCCFCLFVWRVKRSLLPGVLSWRKLRATSGTFQVGLCVSGQHACPFLKVLHRCAFCEAPHRVSHCHDFCRMFFNLSLCNVVAEALGRVGWCVFMFGQLSQLELRARCIFRTRLKATILWLPRRLFVLHTLPGTHEKSRPSLNGSLLDMFGRLWFVHVCSHTAQVQFMK